jgi:hypothetical protein
LVKLRLAAPTLLVVKSRVALASRSKMVSPVAARRSSFLMQSPKLAI